MRRPNSPTRRSAFATYGAIGCLAAIIVPALVTVAMCSSNDEAALPASKAVTFEGITIAGGLADAVRSGFKCEGTAGVVCRRTSVRVAGVDIPSAAIYLEKEITADTPTVEDAPQHYEAVQLQFADRMAAEKALTTWVADGWQNNARRSYRTLTKAGVPVELVWSSQFGDQSSIELRGASAAP